jgi:nitrite reductase/ring-hydroxylating ferredoxin subunit
MLAQLPVGAWTSAALVDVVALALPPGETRAGADRAARALLGIGLAAAPATAAAGVTDWSKLLPEQQRVGLVHASANTVALGLLTASFVRRGRGGGAGRLLGLLGVGAAAAGAGIGGHLAYRWAAGPNHAQDVPHVSPSEWTDVGALEEFAQRAPVLRHVGDTPVVVVRQGSTVTVLADHCSHLSGPLHEGQLVEDRGDTCIVCPWHGSTFVLEDGAVRHGPATAPQPGFDVEVRDGVVRARVRPPA